MLILAAPAGAPFWMDPTFWVGVAFAILIGYMLKVGVPAMIGKALDERAAGIKKDIDEARRLREDAEKLLADYKKKHADAENEAKAIVENARREAEALAAETKKALAETIQRRKKMAEDKIARAEAQAVAEVRTTAVDLATTAAERLLADKMAGASGGQLIDQSIRDLKGRLN